MRKVIIFLVLALAATLFIRLSDVRNLDHPSNAIVIVDRVQNRPRPSNVARGLNTPSANRQITTPDVESSETKNLNIEFESDEDKRFPSLERNTELEDRLKAGLAYKFLANPYLVHEPAPDVECRNDKCRVTGQFVPAATIENVNFAIGNLRDTVSDDAMKSQGFDNKTNYYTSKNGRTYFRYYIIYRKDAQP